MSDQHVRPAGWRILIKVAEIEEKTAAGIIIPDIAKANERVLTSIGQVVALGPMAYRRPDLGLNDDWCFEGDWVMFGKYAGARHVIDGVEYRLMNDDEILAVVPETIKDRVKRAA